MAGISFSGLATGIDSATIVRQLMSLERLPVTRLQRQQSQFSSTSRTLSSISDKLKALDEAGEALNERSKVLTSQGSSTDETMATVTADGGATLGDFSLEITQLARAERTYSNTFAAKDQSGLFGTGTVSIQVGAEAAVDIDVTATDTLDSIAQKINEAGVSATAGVVFDGTTYRLQVSGTETGLANAISFTETGVSLGLDNPLNETVSAADAVFELDGIPMTRSTNTVSDALEGVNITLKNTTTTPINIGISRDPSEFTETVQGFVDAYNAVINDINNQSASSGSATVLSGDFTLRSLQSNLSTTIQEVFSGLPEGFSRLGALGVEVSTTGTLTLDATKLEKAFNSDAESVAKVFAGTSGATSTDGITQSIATLVENYTNATDGFLTQRIDSFSDRISAIDDQILDMEFRLTKTEEILRDQFAALESLSSSLQVQSAQLLGALGTLPSTNNNG